MFLIIHGLFVCVIVEFVITESVCALLGRIILITVLKLASIPGHTELTRWPYGGEVDDDLYPTSTHAQAQLQAVPAQR